MFPPQKCVKWKLTWIPLESGLAKISFPLKVHSDESQSCKKKRGVGGGASLSKQWTGVLLIKGSSARNRSLGSWPGEAPVKSRSLFTVSTQTVEAGTALKESSIIISGLCYYCWLCAFEDPACPRVHFLSPSPGSLKSNSPRRLMNHRPPVPCFTLTLALCHIHTHTLIHALGSSYSTLQPGSVCFINLCHINFKQTQTWPDLACSYPTFGPIEQEKLQMLVPSNPLYVYIMQISFYWKVFLFIFALISVPGKCKRVFSSCLGSSFKCFLALWHQAVNTTLTS